MSAGWRWRSMAMGAGVISTLSWARCTLWLRHAARWLVPARLPLPRRTASTSATRKSPRSWPSFPQPSTASREACTALGTPITGGNVSLYNETKGVGIYPTPVIGIVGILEDVSKAVPADFQRTGDLVLLHRRRYGRGSAAPSSAGGVWLLRVRQGRCSANSGASSTYLDLMRPSGSSTKCLAELSEQGLISSAFDISDGGIAVAIAQASFRNGIGANVEHDSSPRWTAIPLTLFGEHGPRRSF